MVNWDKMLAFETPRMIRIEDARIGGLNKCIQLLFFFAIILFPFIQDQEIFFMSATPTIDLSWYAELGTLSKTQDLASTETYCKNNSRPENAAGTNARAMEATTGNNIYDTDTSCKSSLTRTPTEAEAYWFEYDHQCIDLGFEEIMSKGERQFSFATKFDQSNAFNQPCDDTDCSTIAAGAGYKFKRKNTHKCQCVKKTSHFVTGVESLDFGVSLFYNVADKQFDVRGTEWFSKFPPLALLKEDGTPMLHEGDSTKPIVFEQGQAPVFPVSTWLEAAGVSLDEENPSLTGCKTTYFNNGVGKTGQYYRVSGININLEFDFKGNLADDWRAGSMYRHTSTDSLEFVADGDCQSAYQKAVKGKNCMDLTQYNLPQYNTPPVSVNVKVRVLPGWSTFGSQVTYDQPDWDGDGKTNILSRYTRGIRFTYSARGRITMFDWMHLLNQIVVASVLMGFAPVITGVVAFSCLPESKVYQHQQKQPINISREYSKFSGLSVLMMFLFKELAKNNDHDSDQDGGKIKETDISNMMGQYMHKSVAAQIADSVMRMGDVYQPALTEDEKIAGHGAPYVGDVHHKNYLTFAEFLEVITDDTMSLAMLRQGLELPMEDFSDDEEDDVREMSSPSSSDRDDEVAVTKVRRGPTLRRQGTTHHASKHGHALPPPHQDWEEKISPDGRSYFSNRKLRKTQWVDPRYA